MLRSWATQDRIPVNLSLPLADLHCPPAYYQVTCSPSCLMNTCLVAAYLQAASQLYKDAVDIVEEEEDGKQGLASDLFRQAIGTISTSSFLEYCGLVSISEQKSDSTSLFFDVGMCWATGGHIRLANFTEAAALLMKFAVACHKLQLRSSQCKAYLGAVVVWLYAQDIREAWAIYQVRFPTRFSCNQQTMPAFFDGQIVLPS